MCRLTLHNSQVYKRDYKCHKLTKKGFFSIFISDKMKRTNGISMSRQFMITVQSDTPKQQKFKQFSNKDILWNNSNVQVLRRLFKIKDELTTFFTRSLQKLNRCPPKYFSQLALSAVVRRHLYFLRVWSSMRVIVLRFPFRIVLGTSFGKC